MGAAQIMGFNHAAIGYPTPQAMFDAFQADVRHQIGALFRFIETNHLQESVRVPDFARFARAYNGQGQEAIYAERMQRYYDAYRRLVESARERIAKPRLPQPGAPTMLNADPELLAAWRKHIAAGFANNQTLFQRLLDGFLRPYWTTVWMYRILFALGILSFVLAATLAIFSGRAMPVYTFGGISAIVVLGYLFNRPLQALEQNLQFLTWLGIVYNSYWTRLTLLNNERTVQSDIDEVTGEAVRRIKELVAEHAKRSKTRTGLQLPFDPQ
jgi:ABC-type multidrug transport system fused ATPase/permease subunit